MQTSILEPWQMTKEDFAKVYLERFKSMLSKEAFFRVTQEELQKEREEAIDYHKHTIRQALATGRPVPPEVLRDYPELEGGNPDRVRFDRASIDSAIAAAKRLQSEKDLYVFATHLGYTIDRRSPPGMQSYIIVHPDGTTETVKPFGSTPNPEVGTCYEDAWRFLIREEEGELIHGSVESRGKRIGHAWVELPTSFIWEPETGKYFTREAFNIATSPIEEHRYSVTEAAIMLARVGKHGPWTEQDRQMLKRDNPMPPGNTPLLKTKPKLRPLAEEALKYDTFEDFETAFLREIKHDRYYHVTDNPNFRIDPKLGPRDMSSLAGPGGATPGKLMITSHLDPWAEFYEGTRNYVAIIDMSAVPKEKYWQVNRGFGNELFVDDPSKAEVIKVVSVAEAKRDARLHQAALEETITGSPALEKFYKEAKGFGKSNPHEEGFPIILGGNPVSMYRSVAQLPEFRGTAWRAESGYWHDPGTTVADIIRFEQEELGNEYPDVSDELLKDLDRFPASDAVWVNRRRKDCLFYLSEGESEEAVGKVYLGEGAKIVSPDYCGGFLVLRGGAEPMLEKGGNPVPRTGSERLSFHERIFGKGSTPPLERLGRGQTVNDLLPMPPDQGPPLPRGLSIRWPWRNATTKGI